MEHKPKSIFEAAKKILLNEAGASPKVRALLLPITKLDYDDMSDLFDLLAAHLLDTATDGRIEYEHKALAKQLKSYAIAARKADSMSVY